MGLLGRLMHGDLYAGTPEPTANFWYEPVPGAVTASGERVDTESARRVSAWYRGRDLLSTVLAMLPLQVYERLPNDAGAELARGNPLYDILHDAPNSWQDSFQFRRQAMGHLIDFGNAYSLIRPGPRGFVDQLHPIQPTRVTPRQVAGGRILYDVRDAVTGQSTTYTQDEIFHLRGASDDGIVGKGILAYARSSVGTALATGSYAGAIFGRGTLNSGVIENPGLLDDEASKRMARSFVTTAGDWHLPKVLEQGSKWVPNTMSPEDAQMVLSQKFTVDDMARWLGVPRQMLENNDPSFGNAEQFDRNFIAYSMGPWLSLFEFAIADQLILNPKRFYAQFTREAIVRGDLAVRWQAHVAAVNAGIKTVDEVRGVENLNKRGGKADELREPQNITGKPAVDAPPTPTPPAGRGARQAPPAGALAELSPALRAIVIESAARVIRKEIAAVQKMAVKYAADGDAYAAHVADFYAAHASLLVQTLGMDAVEADAYCAGQASQVLADVRAMEQWDMPAYAEGLAAWALEREEIFS